MKKKMKILKYFLFLICFAFYSANCAFATELPAAVTDLVKKTFPNASIRFDGLIELPDGTQYLPVLPYSYASPANPVEILSTIPANKPLSAKPDLVLFANNFSLLKIIRTPGQPPTIISGNNIPLKVKLGYLPQDLIVPENLIIPSELKVILGDLKILVKEDNVKTGVGKVSDTSYDVNQTNSKNLTKNLPKISEKETNFAFLRTKLFYTTDLKTSNLYVLSPLLSKPQLTVQMPSIPSSVVSAGRYLLITLWSRSVLAVVDISNNTLIKEIEVSKQPAITAYSKTYEKAYISDKFEPVITKIDLNSMTVLGKIKLTGIPSDICLSVDEKTLYYADSITGKIYAVNVAVDDKITEIIQSKNVFKIRNFKDYLFVMSRLDNTLNIYTSSDNKLVKTLSLPAKPVDIKTSTLKDRIYVLSAGEKAFTVIDAASLEIIKSIPLKSAGFPKNITFVENYLKAIISSPDSNEFALIDLTTEEFVDYVPVALQINTLVITQP